ncbi:MAG: helix-turn-helix transcriptional regulator [Candidatus Roseilinea sp.]|nr:MAG: helix-turn-helix transcriptional regulator [Candidatus Roseilinea sp.]
MFILLTTKLHIPPLRSKHVLRPRLIERLSESAHRKLILVSAPAGFGKTTLVSEWVAGSQRPVAWLSLDENDNDPARFLTYLIAALQQIQPDIGQAVSRTLQIPQPPPVEATLTALLNDIAGITTPFTLVLDDYHVITAQAIDEALTFWLENAPPQMGLIIATREDPGLPLHRLRARDQLTELRAADLRFTPAEAASFLTQVMGLRLSAEDIATLEARTEGWIAGLQLAALSMQGVVDADITQFIQTFAGSHRFILDYLLEEVLHKQPEPVQHFLLHTSILDRLCGPLCDVLLDAPAGSGQRTLESLEQANLFIIPLDAERRWYRYHHLFADLLRQRLTQLEPAATINALHLRASQWHEDNGYDLEAFRHAAAAGDVDRAERLIDGKGIPLHLRGAAMTILNWLASLPEATLNARPALWWRHAALLLVNGQTTGVEEKLDAAERAVQGMAPDDNTRNLIGRIAAARATLALTRYQPDVMIAQARRALDYLSDDYLSTRANAHWTMGYAHFLRKDYAASRRAFSDGIALGQAGNAIFSTLLATTGLGNVQEVDNQLHQAADTFRQVLRWAGDQPLQIVYDAHLGLARLNYEWNDLDAAQKHGEQSLHLARQYDRVIDRFIVCEVFLARLTLARGNVDEAAEMLTHTYQTARQKNFALRIPEVVAAQVPVLLRQGRYDEALRLAQSHALPLSEAQAHLAMGDSASALALLDSLYEQADAGNWADERLNIMAWQTVALHALGERDRAAQRLSGALALAEPEGFIRLFVDKGEPMRQMLVTASAQGVMPDYVAKLLAAFEAEPHPSDNPSPQPLPEPLSPRELEVLRLIAQGLSNQDIGARLFLALDTVKGHNRRIFEKLGVQRRTEAVARARALGLL